MLERVSGVLVPVTTPFDKTTGDIAPVPLRENARTLLDHGVEGLLASGSTGEAAMLTEGESRQVVSWLRDVVPADRTLLVGTGRESTRATIDACRAASEDGADGVLVRTPSYYASGLTDESLVDHFRAVADASPVPVLIYNIPKYTHVALTDRLLRSLAEHPNIIGAKDSSGDLKNFAAYRDAVPGWSLLVGSGALLYAALEMGAEGGILGVANFASASAVEVWSAFSRGDRAGAGAAQEALTPLHQEIVAKLGPPGVKAALDAVGLFGGPTRLPLPDVNAAQKHRVREMLRSASLTIA